MMLRRVSEDVPEKSGYKTPEILYQLWGCDQILQRELDVESQNRWYLGIKHQDTRRRGDERQKERKLIDGSNSVMPQI